jgi:glycosyltransferase involved in cell wall biosynthesis
MENKKMLLIFHKPLTQVDGQTKYVKELIRVASEQYEVEIPSEEFFTKYGMKNRNWILRTFLINIYLSFWVIRNKKYIRNQLPVCIMEDRYSMFPTFLLLKLTGIKLISRVSDWGEEYVDTLNIKGRIPALLIGILDHFYRHFVMNSSEAAIVPSEYLNLLLGKNFKKPILNFPLICSISAETKDCRNNYNNIRDEDHDIYCVLIGNFNYLPNEKAAMYLIKEVAPTVKKADNRIKFLIVGAGSDVKFSRYNSENIISMGMVDELDEIYSQCQIGINLSVTTGGTSIKNIEYLVNGLVVISTPEAAIGVIRSSNLFVTGKKDFLHTVLKVSAKIREKDLANVENEAQRVRQYYSEDRISTNALAFLKTVY